jgi:hypothetical protein
MAYGRSKSGGFVGNLSKLGGRSKKLSLKTDMRSENMHPAGLKKASKQAHKKV